MGYQSFQSPQSGVPEFPRAIGVKSLSLAKQCFVEARAEISPHQGDSVRGLRRSLSASQNSVSSRQEQRFHLRRGEWGTRVSRAFRVGYQSFPEPSGWCTRVSQSHQSGVPEFPRALRVGYQSFPEPSEWGNIVSQSPQSGVPEFPKPSERGTRVSQSHRSEVSQPRKTVFRRGESRDFTS